MSLVWTKDEIDLIVADHFDMLMDELAGRPYSKAEHRRALMKLIDRNEGSIEFKHQNISAVLMALGEPWINGYKPKANFQNALVDGVVRWLDARPGWAISPHIGTAKPEVIPSQILKFGPQPALRNEPPPIDPAFSKAIAQRYDVAGREARNRELGRAGELLVLAHEQHSLRTAGRDDLADKVRWTSVQDGDGAGYDIASFEADGRERVIEVKTTNGWDRTPFHISRNEIAVAQSRSDEWHLMRVWNFARKPRAFALRPPLDTQVELTATSFLASFR